ncbi:MAG: ATP-binding protein [Singulisphaera sp.]
MATLEIGVNPGKEIYEIASDFANPVEVLRESLHNSYDAGAEHVSIVARTQKLRDGRRVLSLDIDDDGSGMDEDKLKNFFGLGFSDKHPIPGRPAIGFKGHGTKIYYQSQEIWVTTLRDGGEMIVSHVEEARIAVFNQQLPTPTVWSGEEAKRVALEHDLTVPRKSGTSIRLVDFTPDSSRVIDAFRQETIENYLRWFTVFGSFQHVVKKTEPKPPLLLVLQGTDSEQPTAINFGHAWPPKDRVNLRDLKQLDDRRPFNYFCKSFRSENYSTEGGYKIDIAACFEGARNPIDRDKGVRRQRAGGLYMEEERYGLWLCKDFIPVEKRFEWLSEEDSPFNSLDSKRLLIFVNCDDFKLTANRGSVGNSSSELLQAVKRATFAFLEDIRDDRDLANFYNEYQEDIFSRLREKDKKALQRRVDRYNKKSRCTIKLPNGKKHVFFEPTREITLFGLISELQLLDSTLLGMQVLDYDDHVGIDLLVKRNGNVGSLLSRERVAYTELKYDLKGQINHTFDSLYAIVCWDTGLTQDNVVQDSTGSTFYYRQVVRDGITYSDLIPPPDGELSHSIKVIVLKRLLLEKCDMKASPNPSPLPHSSATSSGSQPRTKRRGS